MPLIILGTGQFPLMQDRKLYGTSLSRQDCPASRAHLHGTLIPGGDLISRSSELH